MRWTTCSATSKAAVITRSDLDTPAGARDFQRFLIGKLRDIRAVVAGASLDDTSNSALMAAWTSLYNSGQPGPMAADQHNRAVRPRRRHSASQTPAAAAEPELEPYLDDDVEDVRCYPDVRAQAAPAAAPVPAADAGIRRHSAGEGSCRRDDAGVGLRPAGFRCPGRCRVASEASTT